MAEVLIQNLRNLDQVVTVMVTIRRMIIPEEGSGGPVWLIEASTNELDAGGSLIPPVRKVSSDYDTLTEDVNSLITELALLIPWDYEIDTDPPTIDSHWPLSGATGISVDTQITINISEQSPSSGIDLDSIRVSVKGFDLTNQVTIKGDVRSASIQLSPGSKYKSAINSDNWQYYDEDQDGY
jgi:hypothetical protein